ncbi:hypothetical protein Tco_0488775 [Tanacetum coccineum]
MNEMNRNILNHLQVEAQSVQFLQQLQPEWSRFARFSNNARSLLSNTKTHKSYAPTSKVFPFQPDLVHATRYKGKEIAKPITPPSESASEEDSDPEQAQKDKDMQKNLALIAKYFEKLYKPTNNNLRTFLKHQEQNWILLPSYKNDNQTNSFGNQGQYILLACLRETELQETKTGVGDPHHKKRLPSVTSLEKGVQLQAEQSDWLADTDEEIDEQELEAHYSYMAKIQEVPNADSDTDAEPLEQECDDERVALANLIANLKLDVDENKKIQKALKKANATLTQEFN